MKKAREGEKYHGRITLSDEDDEARLIASLEKLISSEEAEEWHEVIPEEAVNWLKDYVPKLAGVLSEDVTTKVNSVIRESMMTGTTLQERMKALRESSEVIQRMTDARIESIARTEITRADAMGRLISMKSNEDVIGVEFSAIMDDRTTEICSSRHGLFMRLDDPRLPENTPPLHCRCRSLLIPCTVYDFPDGLLTSHEYDEVPSSKQRDYDIEEVRKILEAEQAASITELIHGVEKVRIDERRGLRGHKGSHEVTDETIKKDYENIGISVDDKYAEDVRSALHDFTSIKYSDMRSTFLKNKRGEKLNDDEKEDLRRYLLCEEYTKIAPTYEGTGSEIYRGIADVNTEYFEKMINLKAGDIFDLEMPSSFSSDKQAAKNFAGMQGIILHVMDTDLMNSPSISGVASNHDEQEILVSDYLWEVVSIDDQRRNPGQRLMGFRGDDIYHITLRRKR